jgi:hypothetical protein
VLMFHKYHLFEPIASFHEIQKNYQNEL